MYVVVRWLLTLVKPCKDLGIDLNIIVVEQDTTSKLNFDQSVSHVFIFNDGFYNRGWAFNVGYRKFNTCDYFFFADNDIILKDHQMLLMFEHCFNFEAVNPYMQIFDTLPEISTLISTTISKKYVDSLNLKHLSEKGLLQTKPRSHTCFSGGVCGISRRAFISISGWDERFRGRGWEDYAMTSKINLFCPKTKTFKFSAYHLYHAFETNTTKENNFELFTQYKGYTLKSYIDLIVNENSNFGSGVKYTPDVKPTKFICVPRHLSECYLLHIGEPRWKRLQTTVKLKHGDSSEGATTGYMFYNLMERHDCEKCVGGPIDDQNPEISDTTTSGIDDCNVNKSDSDSDSESDNEDCGDDNSSQTGDGLICGLQ